MWPAVQTCWPLVRPAGHWSDMLTTGQTCWPLVSPDDHHLDEYCWPPLMPSHHWPVLPTTDQPAVYWLSYSPFLPSHSSSPSLSRDPWSGSPKGCGGMVVVKGSSLGGSVSNLITGRVVVVVVGGSVTARTRYKIRSPQEQDQVWRVHVHRIFVFENLWM